jgi:hypothetical protein
MDYGFFSDPYIWYIVGVLIAIALLRYALRKPAVRKAGAIRFEEIKAKAEARGRERRLQAERRADKLFEDQKKGEAKPC